MKRHVLSLMMALLLSGAVAHARDLHSPDGQWAVRAENQISLIDSHGETVLCLVKDTSGDERVEVAWSPDSKHVVVVENGPRVGSGIVAAWKDRAWHKTIESETEVGTLIRSQLAKNRSRLVSEQRKLAGWLTPTQVLVRGELTFTNGLKCRYGYTLEFHEVEGHLDRGGYEEGQLVASNYQLL